MMSGGQWPGKILRVAQDDMIANARVTSAPRRQSGRWASAVRLMLAAM